MNILREVNRLIRSKNRKKHTDRPSKWSSRGGGMSKHYSSGHSGQHPRVKAKMMMEYNRIIEEEKLLKEMRSPKMYDSVSKLFRN